MITKYKAEVDLIVSSIRVGLHAYAVARNNKVDINEVLKFFPLTEHIMPSYVVESMRKHI